MSSRRAFSKPLSPAVPALAETADTAWDPEWLHGNLNLRQKLTDPQYV